MKRLKWPPQRNASPTLVGKEGSTFKFWLVFFLLNLFLITPSFFIPHFIWPVNFANGSLWNRLVSILSFFRTQNYVWLSLDVFFFATILFWLAKGKLLSIARTIFVFLFDFLFIYELYEVVMIRYFSRTPNLYNDLHLLLDGLNLILDLPIRFGLALFFFFLVLIFLLLRVFPWLFDLLQSGAICFRNTRFALGWSVIFALLMVALLSYYTHANKLKDREALVQSSFDRFTVNLSQSYMLYHKLAMLAHEPPDTTYRGYKRLTLGERPNIYLFLIESYGKVFLQHPDLERIYRPFMKNLEDSLKTAGFHMASNFSQSPIRGGNSWLSIASVLGGVHIDNQPLWLKYTSRIHANLPGFLREMGYTTVSLQPSVRKRPGRALRNRFGFDHYITFRDLHYTGPPFGWALVPDQYSLSYVDETLLSKLTTPIFLFFMTDSPHFPWQDIPPYLNNWRDFLTPSFSSKNRSRSDKNSVLSKSYPRANPDPQYRYATLILYDLRLIDDFLRRHANQKEIAIILGDHQPPVIGTASDGFQTPIHIISNDSAFIADLRNFGFLEGFIPTDSLVHPIHHEAIFSLLVRVLANRYGKNACPDFPTFRPMGASLSIVKE